MNYELLEQEVADRLGTIASDGFTVQRMPETVAEYAKPAVTNGSVIVAYKGSEFDITDRVPRQLSVDNVVQVERATIEVVLRARVLRGAGGLYDLKDKVQARLLGYRPTDWARLSARSFTYVAFEEGVWVYAFTFECDALALTLPDPVDEVLVTQINVDSVNVTT